MVLYIFILYSKYTLYIVYNIASCLIYLLPHERYTRKGFVFLFHLFESANQSLNTGPGLLSTGHDLLSRQDEAAVSGIPKLSGEDVLATDDILDVVDTGAGGLVDGVADGAEFVGSAVDFLQGVDEGGGEGLEFVVVIGEGFAGVAVCYGNG